jgi:hypothetical protein
MDRLELPEETVARLQAAIEALEKHHTNIFGAEDCRDCQYCQTIRSLKLSVNALHTAVFLAPVYEEVIEETMDEEERQWHCEQHWADRRAIERDYIQEY